MVSSAHKPHGGYLLSGEMSMNALYAGMIIILVIEANAIWGKMLGVISSVRSVIISSFVLTIIISGLGTYLYANGDEYVGEFWRGNPHGQGAFTFNNGKSFLYLEISMLL